MSYYKTVPLEELEKMLANIKGIIAAPAKTNDPTDPSVPMSEQNLLSSLNKIKENLEQEILERSNAGRS